MVPDDQVSFAQCGRLVWIRAMNDKIIKGYEVGEGENIEPGPDKREAVAIGSNADLKTLGRTPCSFELS
jgi:hypothetical protein